MKGTELPANELYEERDRLRARVSELEKALANLAKYSHSYIIGSKLDKAIEKAKSLLQ
jgi:hypothetical protein